ncbi:FDLD family class I lanthipeptide [Tumebacillus avium]|nr:FDLD family class I lanthipeptide [Tumebacillus avium]
MEFQNMFDLDVEVTSETTGTNIIPILSIEYCY